MAETKARKKPVRTAPARKDYPTEIAWLQAKLEHAEQQQQTEAKAKVERIDKQLQTVQVQRAKLDARHRELIEKRDALNGLTFSSTPAEEV